MLKVIAAPTNLSRRDEPAIVAALDMARRTGASVRLVLASHDDPLSELVSPDEAFDGFQGDTALEIDWREGALQGMAMTYAKEYGVPIAADVVEGAIGPALRKYVLANSVDLIVMNSHRRGVFERIALGGVGDYLLRTTNVPILFLARHAEDGRALPEFTSILVPLDGSERAEGILPLLDEMTGGEPADVTLARVLVPHSYSQREVQDPVMPWWEPDVKEARSYLDHVARGLRASRYTVSTQVLLHEDPAVCIAELSELGFNLIAMATRGSRGLERLVSGSVADRVLRSTSLPVLLVHSPDADPAPSSRAERETVAAR